MTTILDFYLSRTIRNHFWINGKEGQNKISQMTVAIAGLGGMGSGVAQTLARLGVKKFKIADNDIIEASNINRQVIATQLNIGKTKIEETKSMLLSIDPSVEVQMYPQGVDAQMVSDFLTSVDIVVDEIDVYPIEAHLDLHREANSLKLPIYSSFVIGMGIHLYKFLGNEYTIQDMYHPQCYTKENRVSGIIKTYLRPTPDYMTPEVLKNFTKELEVGNVPIFGPSCLLGHSIVATRIVLDYLEMSPEKTPIMPEFISLDATCLRATTHVMQAWEKIS